MQLQPKKKQGNGRQEYLLAYLLENLPAGTSFSRWPLHITIIPWFEINEPVESFISELQSQTAFRQAFTVTTDGSERWSNHTVQLLQPSPALLALHADLLAFVRQHAKLAANRYVGDAYTPHITQKAYAKVQEGFSITINRIHLIEAPQTNPFTRIKKVTWVGALQ